MHNYLKLLVFIMLTSSSCALFQPKDIGRNTVNDLTENIKELTSEERIQGIVKSAIEGALEGTSTEKSEESIKELVTILTNEIKEKMNPVLAELDTKPPAEKLVNGAIESLTSEENKKKINSLLKDILSNTDDNLEVTIASLEKNLNKTVSSIISNLKKELGGMDQIIADVFSSVLQDSLSALINGTIAGIDMEMISSRISTELLTKQLRDTINQIVKEASQNVTNPVVSVLDVVKKNSTSFALLVAALIILIIYVRRMFVKKDHDMKHAKTFAAEMTKAIDKISSEDNLELEKKIKGVLSDEKNYDKYKEI